MSSPTTTPFEWLSGGLLSFGKKTVSDDHRPNHNHNHKSRPNIAGTIQDIYDSFHQLVLVHEPSSSSPSSPQDKKEPFTPTTTTTTLEELASHISQIRLWLYEERMSSSSSATTTSSTHSTATTATTTATTIPLPPPPTVAQTVVETLTVTLPDMVPLVLTHFSTLPFESRKDVSSILQYLYRCGLDGSDAPLYHMVMTTMVSYTETHYHAILTPLLTLHSEDAPPDMALHGGSILRSLWNHESLYELLVTSPSNVQTYLYPFLDIFVHSPNFDRSTDATETLKMIMTGGVRSSSTSSSSSAGTTTTTTTTTSDDPQQQQQQLQHEQQQQLRMQQLAADCLLRHYEDIFDQRFNPKLLDYKTTETTPSTTTTTTTTTNKYMIRRMALQILSTVLLTRPFYQVMMTYIGTTRNLRLVMNLLRDSSPHITLDAFHVFKIFVANPHKSPAICKILKSNQRKLCVYLETSFHPERERTDSQFRDEKALVIRTLQQL